ncbi:MAG: DUF2330 domain-containing protein [Chloroflexi bacterium]|nr:DUF2330 domain-containing protein [Chloroflexota bacterium]
MRRLPAALAASLLATAVSVIPAAACGGLIGPNGAVNLLRTTTFVGFHDGVEHYVTAFAFAGGGGQFGSITPLPGIPTSVEKGGDWTLQRLILETDPPVPSALPDFAVQRADGTGVEVLLETRIDALDLTVLRGGGDAVGQWAIEHGFRLPPDAPEVLDFYAERSPIFLAAAFDADAAAEQGQGIGDGTPVHITIPTDQPWVPLRILSLGKTGEDRVDADVYLLTDRVPTILPAATGDSGIRLTHTAPARKALLDDLRSDRGMEWVPESAWLMKVVVDAKAIDLRYDLAIDATGAGAPSRVAAGLERPASDGSTPVDVSTTGATALAGLPDDVGVLGLAVLLVAVAAGGATAWTRRTRRPDVVPVDRIV